MKKGMSEKASDVAVKDTQYSMSMKKQENQYVQALEDEMKVLIDRYDGSKN